MNSTLVIGYGNIGERHARILSALGCEVSVVSRRAVPYTRAFQSLEDALANSTADYVVIANETSAHFPTLRRLAEKSFRGKVLVEKPIFDRTISVPNHAFSELRVAYNLRFHPVIRSLRELTATQRIVTMHVYVGHYLPLWRPSRDYRDGYWAKRALGGGVLRELSHELDYVSWLLGGWQAVCASGGHMSLLDIDGDDVFSILLKTERCSSVTIHINCLDRLPRREIVINTDDDTYRGDLLKGIVCASNLDQQFNIDRDFTYVEEHKAMLNGRFSEFCTAEEAQEVLRLIEACEKSSGEGTWIQNRANVPTEFV